MAAKGYTVTPEQRQRMREAKRRWFREWALSLGPEDFPETKRCCGCGETKPMDEFYMQRRKLKSGLTSVRPISKCKSCKKTETNARRNRERAEGVDVNERMRQYHAKRDLEERRRYQREYAMRKRREEGIPEKGPWMKYRKWEAEQGKSLPLGPIAKLLKREIRLTGFDIETIAAATKMHPRRLYAILHLEEEGVTLRVVDAILTGLGLTHELPRLYPTPPIELDPGYRYIEEAS